jgi:hypothetical protein
MLMVLAEADFQELPPLHAESPWYTRRQERAILKADIGRRCT